MNDVHERTTLEHIERAITEEFGEEGHGSKDAVLLVAGALVEIAKTLLFFRAEMERDRAERDAEEKKWREEERQQGESTG